MQEATLPSVPRVGMSRWKAASIHLAISAAIGAIVAALLFFVWYPQPYFHAAGADLLVLLLVGVDLVLGPLLTLVVFRSGKKGLRFDLCVIALAQVAALVYGMSVVLRSRPIFLVGALDRYVLVAANDITDEDLAKGKEPQFRSRSWTGPRLAVAELPTDQNELNDLAFAGAAGRDVQNQPRYFRAAPGATDAQLLPRAKPLEKLRHTHPNDAPIIDRWLANHGRKDDNVRWLPLMALKDEMVVLVDAATGEVLGVLPIEPVW